MPTAEETLRVAVASLEDDKAEDIVVIDLTGKDSFADYLVIASGRSDRHVGALADHIVEKLKTLGHPTVPAEGMERCDWVLLDGSDVVIHLFKPEIRAFYNLEKLWGEDSPTAFEMSRAELIA